jgi:hypothetical protein
MSARTDIVGIGTTGSSNWGGEGMDAQREDDAGHHYQADRPIAL